MVSSLILTVVMAMLVLLFFFNLLPQIYDLVTLSQGQGFYSNQDEIQEVESSSMREHSLCFCC
jgi:hypothetical protein